MDEKKCGQAEVARGQIPCMLVVLLRASNEPCAIHTFRNDSCQKMSLGMGFFDLRFGLMCHFLRMAGLFPKMKTFS